MMMALPLEKDKGKAMSIFFVLVCRPRNARSALYADESRDDECSVKEEGSHHPL